MNPPPSLGLAQRAHSGWVVLGQERTHTSWIDEPLATYPRYLSKYLCWVRTCPGTVGQVCPTVHPVVLYLAGAWSTQPRARYPSSSPKHELRLEEKGNPSGHAGPVTPSAQLQLSTSHQFAQPFWGHISTRPLSCPVLSCPSSFLSRQNWCSCQCQLEETGGHTVPRCRCRTHAACGYCVPCCVVCAGGPVPVHSPICSAPLALSREVSPVLWSPWDP